MKKLLLLASAMLAVSAMAEDPYIESLGTSGISTGYRMKGGISRVEVDFALTTTENSHQWRVFGDTTHETTLGTMFYYTGSSGVGVGHTFRIRGLDSTTGTWNTKNGDSQWTDTQFYYANLNRYTLVTDLKNGKNQIVSGSTVNTKTFDASLFTGLVADLPLSLFANYANACATAFGNSAKAKIYGVKIYENYVEGGENAPVHNFVPCLKDGETPCFKDLVGGGFIIGENIAAFRAGGDNVPAYQDDGYLSTVSETAGEYLYVDTGYQVKNTTCVELDCAIASNRVGELGWQLFDANNTARFQINYPFGAELGYNAKGSGQMYFDKTAFPKPTSVKDVRRTYILDIPGTAASIVTAGFTNKTVTLTGTTSYGSNSGSLKLACAYNDAWAIDSSGLAPLKIYGCKIYESGTLIHDFVPYVKNEESGLLDLKTGTLIKGKSKTSGAAGAETNLPYGGAIKGEQDAYIESNGSTGMSSGYKMKGNISRVEVEYSLTDIYSCSKRIFGDNSANEPNVKTLYYFTGTAGDTGGLATFRIVGANGTAHGQQYTISDVPMDLSRRTAIVDLDNGKLEINTEAKRNSKTFASFSSYRADFQDRVAALPLSLYANYNNAAGTTFANCAKARIYSVRFYENYVEGGDNTPVRELIPYSRGGVVGFYDTVTGEIVKNDSAAAGSFTFGGAGTDHGSLNCYIKPGYDDRLDHGDMTTLTAYAPGAVSYRWLCDGEPIVGGTEGELTVSWLNGGTKADDGFHLHSYQAIAVFNLYGVERESEPSAAADVKSRPLGLCVIIR